MQAALDELWMYTGEMFEVDEVDELMAARGVCASADDLRRPWLDSVASTLEAATLSMPSPDAWMQTGGRKGRHGEHMGYLLAEMQFLQRAYPGRQW
jgi:ring-1,2-phenylacetyl-CoA epoxidase subunit PaaC